MIVNREDQTTTCATFAAVPLQRVAVSSATNVHVRFKVDTSVEPPQVYSALVRAVNRVGNGVWSCPSANDLIYRAPPAPRGRRGAAEAAPRAKWVFPSLVSKWCCLGCLALLLRLGRLLDVPSTLAPPHVTAVGSFPTAKCEGNGLRS